MHWRSLCSEDGAGCFGRARLARHHHAGRPITQGETSASMCCCPSWCACTATWKARRLSRPGGVDGGLGSTRTSPMRPSLASLSAAGIQSSDASRSPMRMVHACPPEPRRVFDRRRCASMAASETSATVRKARPSMLAPWPSRGSCSNSRAGSIAPTTTGSSENVQALHGVVSPAW